MTHASIALYSFRRLDPIRPSGKVDASEKTSAIKELGREFQGEAKMRKESESTDRDIVVSKLGATFNR